MASTRASTGESFAPDGTARTNAETAMVCHNLLLIFWPLLIGFEREPKLLLVNRRRARRGARQSPSTGNASSGGQRHGFSRGKSSGVRGFQSRRLAVGRDTLSSCSLASSDHRARLAGSNLDAQGPSSAAFSGPRPTLFGKAISYKVSSSTTAAVSWESAGYGRWPPSARSSSATATWRWERRWRSPRASTTSSSARSTSVSRGNLLLVILIHGFANTLMLGRAFL